jgi:hypothetical protein
MESKEQKMVNFIADLKASNIAVNITSLKDYSMQIELLLNQIKIGDNNEVARSNLKHCEEVVKTTQNTASIELLDEYIKLGNIFKFLIPDIKNNATNLKYGKQIAIHYLDIAKLTKDERIKNLAFAIADELSQ